MPVMNNYYILRSYSSKFYVSLHAGKSRGVFVAKRATDRMPPVGRGSEALFTGNRCVRPPITKRSTEPSRRQRDEHNNRFSFYTTIHTYIHMR